MVKASAKKILFVTVIASLIGLPLFAQAQDKPLKKISWGVTSLSASNWIPWLAKEAKIYEKNGLDVELILVKGSGQTSTAILGGSLFAAPVAVPTGYDGSSGRRRSGEHRSYGARSSEQTAGQARNSNGPKISRERVSRPRPWVLWAIFCSSTSFGKTAWIPLGTSSGSPSAHRRNGFRRCHRGNVDAADLSYPTDVQAQRLGYRVLWDARKEVVYPSMSIVTRRKTMQEDRDTVMRMLRSHIEGIAYLKTHKEFSMKVLSKYLRTNDQELLEGSYAIFKEDFISTPYPIMKGLEATYDYVAQTQTGDSQSQTRRIRGPEFGRRAGQERVYQETVRTEITKKASGNRRQALERPVEETHDEIAPAFSGRCVITLY